MTWLLHTHLAGLLSKQNPAWKREKAFIRHRMNAFFDADCQWLQRVSHRVEPRQPLTQLTTGVTSSQARPSSCRCLR